MFFFYFLRCLQRDGGDPVPPGCSGTDPVGNDYCYDSITYCNSLPATELCYVADDGYPASQYPLPECRGDCDSDSDCDVGLICYDVSGMTMVPGCTGTRVVVGSSTKDYCYNPGIRRNEEVSHNLRHDGEI